MPGIIRVSVLEVVDLPEVLTDGTTVKGVTAKVTLGPRLFKTQPGVADGGRIETWNSDFAFPVMNLRDKLVISICDSEDHSVTQTAIEIPSIIQKGSRDEFVSLNKGGRIHLRMSFVLTDEERKKIEKMRMAALKRREEMERLKKTVVYQPVQESLEKELKKSPAPTGAVADVDLSTIYDKKDSKEQSNGSLGLYSTPEPQAPKPTPEQEPKSSPESVLKPMFNYAKAIGVQSGMESTEWRSISFVPNNLVNVVMASNGDFNPGVQRIKDAVDVDSSGTTTLNAFSAASPGCINGAKPLVTKSIDCIPQSNLTPPGGSDSLMNEVKTYNLKNAGELGSSENAQLHVSLVSPTNSDGPSSFLTKPTGSTRVAENASNEVMKNMRDGYSEAVPVRGIAGYAGPSGALNISVVDSASISGPEAASLSITSIDSASEGTGQPSGIPSSGPMKLKTVNARVKRTLSKVSLGRSVRRASSSTVVRTQTPVLVVWLRNWVRQALSNVKGCCRAPA